MQVPSALRIVERGLELVFMGGTAGAVWQSRQAWLSEASGFCGRLG